MTVAYTVFRLSGISEAIKKLKKRQNRLGDWRDAFQRIATDFYAVEKGWLDSKGRGQWAPLRPVYAAWKRKRYPRKPLMQLTGALHADLIGKSGGLRLRRDGMVISAPLSGRRWRDHEEGSSRGNTSGYARTVRKVISPAMRIRRTTWNKILKNWASGD